MSQKRKNNFLNKLKKGKTEEDIKAAYAKYFDIAYNTADRHDLYTNTVLFEFKYDKNFKSLKALAQVIAQTLYYVRRLKFGTDIDKGIPNMLCFADNNEAVLTETIKWKSFYDNAEKYDWDLAPSKADKNLVNDIAEFPLTKKLHVYDVLEKTDFEAFENQLNKALQGQIDLKLIDKKVITEENFEQVFEYWNKIFGDSVRNGFKTSRYFVSDIQRNNTIFLKEQGKALFRVGELGNIKEKKILTKDYEHFWGLYEKVRNADTLRAIFAKIDRLTDEQMRRFHGEFFTPIRFAKKALDYLEKTLGKQWWKTGEYRLWDMAAGTGNLEYHLPQDALKYCYLSTLYKEDVEHLEKLFADANVFQYDYLNDDIANVFAKKAELGFEMAWKMPKKLKEELENPNIKWIILINPPFATAGTGGTKGNKKQGVADTLVRKMMHKNNLGEVSRELFSQFIYRIKHEFEGKTSHLALFSTLKYINANNAQKLRDKIFHFTFEKGFVFSSANFAGTKKNNAFPVGMLLWNLNKTKHLEKQHIELDIFDENVEKIGTKVLRSVHKSQFLSKWVKRPRNKYKFPPLGSGITVKDKNKDRRDKIAEGFVASLMAGRNDFQHQNLVYFLSGPAASAGAYSVTAENFEKSMIIHAAQRLPKATWLNDRDQFMRPNKEVSDEFVADCTIWNLFSNSNQTAALQDVFYEGETYQIHNHFFPFSLAELKKWDISDSDIAFSLLRAEERFMSVWLSDKILSEEAQAVLDKGKTIYQYYFAHLHELRTPKFKITTWDAGFWQIRKALSDVHLAKNELEELKNLHNILKAKLLPQLKYYGIIE